MSGRSLSAGSLVLTQPIERQEECLGACQDQEPCKQDKPFLCWQEGPSASSISWLRISPTLICSRSWQSETLHSQFFVGALLPDVLVCFGCRRPWPSDEDISQPIALWKGIAMWHHAVGMFLFALTAHGNGKIQPESSESLKVAALLPPGTEWIFL